MALICQICPSVDVTLDGTRARCDECGHEWAATLRTGSTSANSKLGGWTADLNDVIASTIATLLESKNRVTGADIDTYLLEYEAAALQAVVDTGAHSTLERAASNGRGWFNRAWTEGDNPHSGRFHRGGDTRSGYWFARP
jgi:hypothetical protein